MRPRKEIIYSRAFAAGLQDAKAGKIKSTNPIKIIPCKHSEDDYRLNCDHYDWYFAWCEGWEKGHEIYTEKNIYKPRKIAIVCSSEDDALFARSIFFMVDQKHVVTVTRKEQVKGHRFSHVLRRVTTYNDPVSEKLYKECLLRKDTSENKNIDDRCYSAPSEPPC